MPSGPGDFLDGSEEMMTFTSKGEVALNSKLVGLKVEARASTSAKNVVFAGL